MKKRPQADIPLTSIDMAAEIAGWVLLIAVWLLTMTSYGSLPDTIPTHFNAAGEVDGYGHKQTLLGIPIILSVLFVGMTILNRYPHIFNYPTAITEENYLRQYTQATRLIRYLKLTIVLIFGLVIYFILRSVRGQSEGLGVWFVPAILALTMLPVLIYLVKSIRDKK